MAKIWKCYNCFDDRGVPGRDFISDEPVCPKCGADRKDPRAAALLVPCRTLHFEPPHPVLRDRGCGKIACGAPVAGDVRITGEPDVANCPRCRETAEWKAAKAARADADEFEVPGNFIVQVDARGKQYVKAEE